MALSVSRTLTSMLVTATFVGAGVLIRKYLRRRPDRGRETQVTLVQESPIGIDHSSLREGVSKRGKVELHCHLNGSVRRETLVAILGDDANDNPVQTIEDAFRQFKRVYRAVDNSATLRRIVRECLEDAVLDNVRYLELRTTPRKLSDVSTRREYVQIVVDEINAFNSLNHARPLLSFPKGKIAVRLILTVDRSQPVSIADQTVDIALRFPGIVVGLDFAGNPTIGTFANFVAVFERARGHGLFITVHTSEIRGVEAETDAILAFKPDRVGHFLFATGEQVEKLIALNVHIEACPTSNLCAISGKNPLDRDIGQHAILERFLRDSKGLISIHTDDPGVFGVRLSDELIAVARSFHLSVDELDQLIKAPAHRAFLAKPEREALVACLSS